MGRSIRAIFLSFLQAVFLFFLYSLGGNWLFENLIRQRFGFGLIEKKLLFAARPLFFLAWSLGLFLLARGQDSAKLLSSSRKKLNFSRGALFGASLVAPMILLLSLSGKVVFTSFHPEWLLPSLGLYTLYAGCSAFSQELILRGLILNNLMRSWGTHSAIWFSALLFGLSHFYLFPLYPYTAFLTGLILGYSFSWHGLYYCVGWHFAWDLLEALAFNGRLCPFCVVDPFFVGEKSLYPDAKGILAIPILLIGVALLFLTHKSKWTLKREGGRNTL